MPAPAREPLVHDLAAQLHEAVELQRAALELDNTVSARTVRELGWRRIDIALDRLIDAL